MGRNILRGDTWNDLDVSAGKTFKVAERVNFQVIASAFNVLNRAYYVTPDINVEDRLSRLATSSKPSNLQARRAVRPVVVLPAGPRQSQHPANRKDHLLAFKSQITQRRASASSGRPSFCRKTAKLERRSTKANLRNQQLPFQFREFVIWFYKIQYSSFHHRKFWMTKPFIFNSYTRLPRITQIGIRIAQK